MRLMEVSQTTNNRDSDEKETDDTGKKQKERD